MSFDSLTLRSVIAQLNGNIIPGKIFSVIQYSSLEFILRIAARDQLYNLLFSIHPVYARIHLATGYPERTNRWHFADFLHKHIQDGEIEAIEQVDFDRIIRIRIAPQTEIVDPAPKLLIGEFMGKHSNVILVEEETGKILESLKHIDETMSRYRQVLPGLSYVAPPMSQELDPFSSDGEAISRIITSESDVTWKTLLKSFQGMSPLLAREIIARSHENSPQAIRDAFVKLMTNIRNEKFYPTVISSNNKEQDLLAVSSIDLQQFPDGHAISFPDISSAVEFFYEHLIKIESFLAKKSAILQSVRKRYEALQQKHNLLEQQLKVSKSADELKLKGDLLIANLHRIKRGQDRVSLQNFYDPEAAEVTIDLDERLNPSSNAQKYFDEYKKAKRAKDITIKLLDKNQAAMSYHKNIVKEIEESNTLGDLINIEDDLEQRGIIKKQNVNSRKRKEEVKFFRRFRSSQGFQIFVGRSDKENDLLLKSESSKNDMWLHAKQIEGSHVIVRNPEKRPDIPKETLIEAAVIAAYFSKAKHSNLVPVDYTWVKYVNKPRTRKSGFVIYTHEKTLFVSPSGFSKISSSQPDG